LEWHSDQAAPQYKFFLEYKYDGNFDLPYFPSEIRGFMQVGRKKQLAVVLKILILKTSATPLAEDYFNPDRYFGKSSAPHQISVLVFSNNESFAMGHDGHLEKVHPYSESVAERKEFENKKHPIMARVKRNWPYLVGVIALSAIWFFFIRKHLRGN
jgi:hypothetical protein